MKILATLSSWYPHYTSSSIGVIVHQVSIYLRKTGNDVDICAPIGGNVKTINPNILRITRIFEPINHFYRAIYFWLKTVYFIKNNYEKYDLFWVHNPNPVIWRFVDKRLLDKISFTIHTTYLGIAKKSKFESLKLNLYYYFMKKNEKIFFKKIRSIDNKIIVISPEVKEELTDFGINNKKIIYIPNGVDINKFRPVASKEKKEIRSKFEIPKDTIVLLSLGRLDEIKKPIKLVETFLSLEKMFNKISLVIVGKGDVFLELQKMSEGNKNIFLMGYIREEDKAKLISCCDSYITSSSYEGQPLAMLESMSSGLMCITSKIPNLEKIVTSANCGMSIDFDDPQRTAHEIATFLQKNKMTVFGANARRYVENNHDWDIVSKKYLVEFKNSAGT